MKIGNQEFGRVAILVLNYDHRLANPAEAVVSAYKNVSQYMREKWGTPSEQGLDVTVLANEELVAEHQAALLRAGLKFFPNWRESQEYRKLLREGLRQGDKIYIMKPFGGFRKTTPDDIEILDPDRKIDIKPKHKRKFI